MPTIQGIDVSRHQGDINWQAVAASDVDFAFLKATDGIRYSPAQTWFLPNIAEAKRTNLILGAYHFLLDHYTGTLQAQFFVSAVNKAGGFRGIIPILDVERELDGTYPKLRHAQDFKREFNRLVPNRPLVIYTGRWFWVGVLGNPPGSQLGPLWHSEYDTPGREVDDGPELDNYGGWPSCKIWQYTSTGRCPGVSGNVDRNIFYGSIQELRALAGLGMIPSTPPIVEGDEDVLYILRYTDEAGRTVIRGAGNGGVVPFDGMAEANEMISSVKAGGGKVADVAVKSKQQWDWYARYFRAGRLDEDIPDHPVEA